MVHYKLLHSQYGIVIKNERKLFWSVMASPIKWMLWWWSRLVWLFLFHYFDGLVQERHNTSASEMELCFSCPNPSIWENWRACCFIRCYLKASLKILYFCNDCSLHIDNRWYPIMLYYIMYSTMFWYRETFHNMLICYKHWCRISKIDKFLFC